MKLPKDYRRQIYGYIEELLGRPLSYEEHDDLRDMMMEYVFSTQNMGTVVRRIFCAHDWIIDRKVEGGREPRAHVKCRKCDKRTKKRVPSISMSV
jgi:hypothetical protein